MHSKLKHSKSTLRANASLILDPEISKKLNAIDINKPLWGSPVSAQPPVAPAFQNIQVPSSSPSPARMSFAPAQESAQRQKSPMLEVASASLLQPLYSYVPVLNMKIGAWQKNSVFCGDIMAKFSYEERKFIWEIYNLNQSFSKVEIPFDEVIHLKYVVLPDGFATLLMEAANIPMFFVGNIMIHKPPAWKPSSDFTKGGPSSTQHVLYFLNESLALSFQHLLKVEPRFKELLAQSEVPVLPAPFAPSFLMGAASGVDQMFADAQMMGFPMNSALSGFDPYAPADPSSTSPETYFTVQSDPEHASEDVSRYFNSDFLRDQRPLRKESWNELNPLHALSVNH